MPVSVKPEMRQQFSSLIKGIDEEDGIDKGGKGSSDENKENDKTSRKKIAAQAPFPENQIHEESEHPAEKGRREKDGKRLREHRQSDPGNSGGDNQEWEHKRQKKYGVNDKSDQAVSEEIIVFLKGFDVHASQSGEIIVRENLTAAAAKTQISVDQERGNRNHQKRQRDSVALEESEKVFCGPDYKQYQPQNPDTVEGHGYHERREKRG